VRTALFASLGLVVLLSSVAQAERTYHYVFDRPVYSGNPGATVDVEVSLEERRESTDPPALLATEGLASAAVKLSYVNPLPSEPAWLTDPASISHNPQFDDSLSPEKYLTADIVDEEPAAVDAIAGLSEWISVNPLATSGALAQEIVAGEVYRIRLGTFRFTLGDILGETTTIRATDLFADPMDETTAFDFTVLDTLIASAEATLVTAPEPASLVLLGAGAVLAGLVVRRTRRQGR